MTRTRRKSADDEFEPCARYQLKLSVALPAGSVIAGDWIDVVPPSMS